MNTLQIINTETQIIPEVNFEYFSDFAQYRLKQMETGQIFTENKVMYSAQAIRIYKSAISLFKEFELLLQSRIKIHEMNIKILQAFERFLISQTSKKTKDYYSKNTIGKYIAAIKANGNFLHDEGIGLKSVKFSVKTEKQPQIYLSLSELQQITNCETLTDGERRAADIFLVQCFTSLRHSTLKKFLKNPFAYVKEHEGKSFIDVIADKTGEQCVIPLSAVVAQIITKYKGSIEVPSEVYMNSVLKTICRKAGIDNPVPVRITKGGMMTEVLVEKFHKVATNTSRRTFITIIRKYIKDDNAVTKMTGHTSISQLSTYIQSTKVDEILPYLNNEFFNIKI